MGNKISKDEVPKMEGEEEPYKNILLFVLIGSNILYEIKRKRIQVNEEEYEDSSEDERNKDTRNENTKKTKMQVSIVQVPLKGISASNEKITEALDLGPIKVHKTRRNSLHSHAVGFTVDEDKNKEKNQRRSHFSHNQIKKNLISKENNIISLILDFDKIKNTVSVDIIENNKINSNNNSEDKHNWSSGSDSSYSQIDDVSSLAVKVSELLMSECVVNERVERWATKLAKAIESRVKKPTKIIIQESDKNNSKDTLTSGTSSFPGTMTSVGMKTTILPHPVEAEKEARKLAKQRKKNIKKQKKSSNEAQKGNCSENSK